MRVKRLKMQSFRGIGDLTLDFDEKEPTVFVGINGVGKSSILDCIAILLSNIFKEIIYPTLNSDSFSFMSPKFRKPITIVNSAFGKVNEYEKATPGQPEIEARLFSETDITNRDKETNNHILISIDSQELKFNASSNNNINYDNNNIVNYFQSLHHQWKENHSLNIPLAVFYSVSRAVIDIDLRIIDTSLFKQIDAYDEALNGIKISFHRFFQWFRSVEDLENELLRDNSNYRDKQLEAVKEAIYSIIPDFSNLRVRRSPTLRMTVQKQGEELIVNQLSDGEKCLLAMVGDLARRLAIANPGLENPLQGAGVVLIDEIELHLHPKWQREIIPALTRTFPNCQFIVTTHSPQVISEVKPEGIHILKKTDEGVTAERPESSYGRDSNQILEDLMGVSKRPLEIKDSLHELFQLIEEGNLDGARQLSQQIADIIGESEPELVKARVSIRRKEILKR